ncbi:MAG TPA: sigma factor-like helix-turn-helix DNA-binding protein [Trebonia sp.]|nr:sigma factor-like helix-turn-helix DNA-binding protein [Trebonia sp.]
MLDTPAERNALLASLISNHGDLVARQSKGDEDDMQGLLLKLLESSPDLLVPEMAAYEIGQIDARIDAVREKIGRAKSEARKTELYARLGKLHAERDQVTAGPWVRTVLYRMAIDRYRVESNRARIIREHAAELADKYSALTGKSAERIVIEKLEDEDIRRRISTLPKALRTVARLRYDGYEYSEIADILDISDAAVWQRAHRIRSPKIRSVLGLPGDLASA